MNVRLNKINSLLLLFFSSGGLQGVSSVYNLKISESLGREVLEKQNDRLVALGFFNQWRQCYDNRQQRVAGGFAAFIYSCNPFYFRIDGAAARVKEEKNRHCFSQVQTDDILFTAGYHGKINDQALYTISGVFGFPTHTIEPTKISFGTGSTGIGAQIDGKYFYAHAHCFLAAARIVHFFQNSLFSAEEGRTMFFRIYPGDLVDILIAHRSCWKKNTIELGYSPSLAFNTKTCPSLDPNPLKVHIRNSVYGSYSYSFTWQKCFCSATAGLAYGFDRREERLGVKSVISLWGSFGINF